MRKYSTLLLLLLTLASYSQDTTVKKQEIKINAFNTIIFKSLEGSYEYLLNEESSVGISAMVNLNDIGDKEDNRDSYLPIYEERMALTGFYRRYFSSKYAWGFFLEGFGMYNVQQDPYNDDYKSEYNQETGDYMYLVYNENTQNFGVGLSIGGKFVSSKGFVFEFYGGVGRNLFTSDADYNSEFIPRLGASFGYRF